MHRTCVGLLPAVCIAAAGAYDTAEIEGLLGVKLTDLYEGNASALRVLGANGALCWDWCCAVLCRAVLCRAVPCHHVKQSPCTLAGRSGKLGAGSSWRRLSHHPPITRTHLLPAVSRALPPPAAAADTFELKKRALHVYAEKQRVPDFRSAAGGGTGCLPAVADKPPQAVWWLATAFASLDGTYHCHNPYFTRAAAAALRPLALPLPLQGCVQQRRWG